MKLLLAIASEPVRAAVARDLLASPDIEAVYECGDSVSAIRQAEESGVDVVLVGADLWPQDGYQTVHEIVGRVPGVSTIIVALNPDPSDFRKALQSGARDLLELPVERKDLLEALKKAAEASLRKRSVLEDMAAQMVAQKEVKVAKRIVVFSTKGGTGKTFVATNLAAGLAASGNRVAIVDLDLQLGDSAIALGLVPQRTIFDLVQGYSEFDIGLLQEFMIKHSSGLSVLPSPHYPDEAEKITVKDVQSVLDVIQTGYDYVIVDTPPFFEERILVALDWADHVLLIAGLDIPSVKHLKTVFRTMGLMSYPDEKLTIVMNRADSKVGLDMAEVERHLGRKVKFTISSSVEVPRALNAGEILILSKPGCKVAHELTELVRIFAPEAAGSRRLFGGR